MIAAHTYLSNLKQQALLLGGISVLMVCVGFREAVSFATGFMAVWVAHVVFYSIAFHGAQLPYMGSAVVRMIVATAMKVLTVAILAYSMLQSAFLARAIGPISAGFFIVGFIACVLVSTVLNARAMGQVSD